MKPEQIQSKFEIIDSLKINFNILSNEPDRFIKSSWSFCQINLIILFDVSGGIIERLKWD